VKVINNHNEILEGIIIYINCMLNSQNKFGDVVQNKLIKYILYYALLKGKISVVFFK